MNRKYIILLRICIVFLLLFFVKLLICSNVTNAQNLNVVYVSTAVQHDNVKYKKPIFNDDRLNDEINKYLDNNKCLSLNYNVSPISKYEVNVYLSCNNRPINFIYNLKKRKFLKLDDFIIDKDKFSNKVKELLYLKYPKDLFSGIDIFSGAFDIKENEIKGYYIIHNNEYSIRINNNEIKGLIKYDHVYDKDYKNEEYKLDTSKKIIAFTFDDGPSIYDKEIVDILKNNHASATFFIVGSRIDTYSDVVKYMVSNNMEVGNHTFDHKSMVKISDEEKEAQIFNTNDKFKNLTNKDLYLFRPSYGAINKDVLVKANMPVILWNVDTLDWKTRNKDLIKEEILNNSKDGSIVLMHSLYASTRDALKEVLPILYERGYEVVSVSELAEIKGVALNAGETYRNIKIQ
jgi:peptidoglycan/xylan/chitin deacetylase (PgdA/CDA1 family)